MNDNKLPDEQQLQESILQHVAADNYQPVKPRVIAKQLGHHDDEGKAAVKKAVKRLVKDGKLSYGSKHLVALPGKSATTAKPQHDEITGVFRRAAAGFGFVRPAGVAPGSDRKEDIFISQKAAGDASSGDVVLVRISKHRQGRRPNREGHIVQVIERDTNRFVGTYFESGGLGYVQIDGKPFKDPILVGDAGAKNCRADDKVVIEMVRFPSHVHQGEGVLVQVLGPRGTPGVDTLSIIHEFGLPGDFPEDVLEDSRVRADEFDESIPAGRRDLTAATIITIDPIDARDFDDAISLEKLDNGHWLLGVHIADVSHFVQQKTPLDREAHDRATSVYLPDRVIPMLPEIISNNLASLQPDRVRYTKSCFMEFTPEGVRTHTEACNAAIKSKRRFAYEEVDEYLADRDAWREKLSPEVHRLLGDMHTLAMTLRRRRAKHGSLELSLPEVKIDLDNDGQVAGAHLVENTESHQIIEEFMLAANMAIAELLKENEWLFLRRVHEPPDPRKLKQLTTFVRDLGVDCESLESRFEMQRVLDLVKGRPEEHAVNYAMLRSMQKAVYSPAEEGHFALASDCYCHFTSPIRRYPDLTVHRLLDLKFAHGKPRNDFGEWAILGEHCSEREQRAEKAERELIKVKLLSHMSQRVGEEITTVVTGVEEFGLFVQGIDLPAEGLIHISSLQDDYYHYERASHTLTGRRAGHEFRLGDFLVVAIARVDVDRRELDFRYVRRADRRAPNPAPHAGGSKPKRSRQPAKKTAAKKKPAKRKRRRK
ncbi:MAG: ribonuclease R [Pirellulales bacterium]